MLFCGAAKIHLSCCCVTLTKCAVYNKLSNILCHRLKHAVLKGRGEVCPLKRPLIPKQSMLIQLPTVKLGKIQGVQVHRWHEAKLQKDRHFCDKYVYYPVLTEKASQSKIPVCISWGYSFAECVSCCVILRNDILLGDSNSCASSLCHNEGWTGNNLQKQHIHTQTHRHAAPTSSKYRYRQKS